MSNDASISDRIAKRMLDPRPVPLRKFMNFKKYSDLIDFGELYVSRSDRFNDQKEAHMFFEETIKRLIEIERLHTGMCKFIPLNSVLNPMDRIKRLLMDVSNFYFPRYMERNGEGELVRPAFDSRGGYHGFDSESAKKIFSNDVDLLRKNTYVTCFCAATSITEYMVRNYGNIIIETDTASLKKAITSSNMLHVRGFHVMYFDDVRDFYADMDLYQEAIHGHSLFGIKSTEYSGEEEYRFVFEAKEISQDTNDNISMPVDLDTLIKKVTVSDEDEFHKVSNFNKEHGCKFPVEIMQTSGNFPAP